MKLKKLTKEGWNKLLMENEEYDKVNNLSLPRVVNMKIKEVKNEVVHDFNKCRRGYRRNNNKTQQGQ